MEISQNTEVYLFYFFLPIYFTLNILLLLEYEPGDFRDK